MSESRGSDLGSRPEFYPCDSCGHLIPTERAYADMETLTVFWPRCLQGKLRSCEQCGATIRASACQELATGRVICEPVLAGGAGGDVVMTIQRHEKGGTLAPQGPPRSLGSPVNALR
jgi:hypothetical protein